MVVWTPGAANSAYFEHAFLARQMGVELVEASDLVVRDGLCYMRTTRGLARVDSIYRRIDDDFMDPLEFRADSLLGVPGLMGCYRAGNVAIANAVGTGVADDKAVYHYVPEMIRYYLGEEPILDNLPTWLLADPEQRAFAMEHIHELVVKPTGESGGQGVLHRTAGERGAQLEAQKLVVAEAPERWIAQQTVASRPSRPRCRTARSCRATWTCARSRVRRRDRGRAGRPHARGAARGLDDREQLAGRRLEGHLGARRGRGRRGRRAGVAARAPGAAGHAPAGLARPGAAATAGARLMLARIAHDLYWLGRHLVRAEHTARMLDGLFHADLQGRPDDPASVTLSWDSLLAIMGAGDGGAPARRDDVIRVLTASIDNPVSIVSCVVTAREGARTLRDTIPGRDVGVASTPSTSGSGSRTSPPGCARAPTRSTRS